MVHRISPVIIGIAVLWACGGDTGGDGPLDTDAPPAAAVDGADASDDRYDRASFVLCPALEDHREELTSIVGFVHNPDRAIKGVGAECIIRGGDFGFVRVTLPPAMVRSIPMHTSSYDAEASGLPELGDGAVFVDLPLQPHVLFMMGNLIIDVDAENTETPSRETMIELALRVRHLLAEANP